MQAPLKGIKVVDLSAVVSGPMAAGILADQGADVIKVETQGGDLTRVIAVGPSAPKEFEQTIASGEALQAVITPTNGGIQRVEAGIPDIRTVREGRPASGRGWIGITPRGAYMTEDITVAPLLPGWLWLLVAATLALAAWLIEGRKPARRNA